MKFRPGSMGKDKFYKTALCVKLHSWEVIEIKEVNENLWIMERRNMTEQKRKILIKLFFSTLYISVFTFGGIGAIFSGSDCSQWLDLFWTVCLHLPFSQTCNRGEIMVQ